MKKILLLLIVVMMMGDVVMAQPGSGYAERAVERKMDSTYRKKGKKAVGDVTYENDKRYKDPNNKVLATIIYQDSSFKKERLKTATSTKMIFGKHGEAYVTRDELKEKEVMYMIFNYAEKANYIVNPKEGTAMKMPLINFDKMMERQAQKEVDREPTDGKPKIIATDEYATFAGCKARKYIVNSADGKRSDMWVSKGLKVNLKDNYMLGARLNTYRFPQNTEYKDMADGMVVRLVGYDGDRVNYTRTLSGYTNDADESYFDMSKYRVTDVLSGL